MKRVSYRQEEEQGNLLGGYYKRSQTNAGAEYLLWEIWFQPILFCLLSPFLNSCLSPVWGPPLFSLFWFALCAFLSPEHSVSIHLFKWLHAIPVMSVSCSFFYLQCTAKMGYTVRVSTQQVFITCIHLLSAHFLWWFRTSRGYQWFQVELENMGSGATA